MKNTITKEELLKAVEELEAKGEDAKEYANALWSNWSHPASKSQLIATREQDVRANTYHEASELLEKRFDLDRLEKKQMSKKAFMEHEKEERMRI